MLTDLTDAPEWRAVPQDMMHMTFSIEPQCTQAQAQLEDAADFTRSDDWKDYDALVDRYAAMEALTARAITQLPGLVELALTVYHTARAVMDRGEVADWERLRREASDLLQRIEDDATLYP